MNVHDRCTPIPGVLRLAVPIFFTLFLSTGYAQTITGTTLESKKPGYSAETVRLDEIRQNRTVNVMRSQEDKVTASDISTPSAGAGTSTRISLRAGRQWTDIVCFRMCKALPFQEAGASMG
ncbi:MAG: hypothetical protein ABW007_25915 [Chitinophagaceae bacterium]